MSLSRSSRADVQAWERGVAEYKDDIEGIRLQLAIGIGEAESNPDFVHLARRYHRIG